MSRLIELCQSISYTVPQRQLLSTYAPTYVQYNVPADRLHQSISYTVPQRQLLSTYAQYNVLADRTPPDSSLLGFTSHSGVRTAQRTARLQSISYLRYHNTCCYLPTQPPTSWLIELRQTADY